MGELRPNTKVDLGRIIEVCSTRGAFVAFKGTDGVGKPTRAKPAADWVKTRGREVVTTCEPGGTNLGRQLREFLLEAGETTACEGQAASRVEALPLAVDRVQHVAELIVPALNVGKIVISGRSMTSSVAYQGQGWDLGPREIRGLSLWATRGLTPNLTVLLDLDPETAWGRQQNDEIRASLDRMEGEGLEFQRGVRARFRRLVEENETWMVVDASLIPEETVAQVRFRLASVPPIMKSW